jgi:hypothetical protein
VLLLDRFADDRAFGKVVGTQATTGPQRGGIDIERVIGIDHGALRFRPLLKTGWGRCGVAYGPFERRNGRTLGIFMLNGHNTSQAEHLADGLRLRLWRWALGTEVDDSLTRLSRLLRSRQKRYLWRRLRQWVMTGTRFRHVHTLDDNLALGWFPAEVPPDPLGQGNAFVMHALGPECGDLRARVGLNLLRAVRGVQNVPIYYFVVLRKQGAAYYAASIPRVPGFAVHRSMRPLAIDAFTTDPSVYAGIHQSVLGQIGFRVDTRVYCAQVIDVPAFESWYGSAHSADSLRGVGPLDASVAEVGGRWHVLEGHFVRTGDGLVGEASKNVAWLDTDAPAGLVHLLVGTTDARHATVGIMWRVMDRDNYWCLELDGCYCRLSIVRDGVWNRFPPSREHRLAPNSTNSLQVSDDGENIRLYLNGDLLFGTTFSDPRLQDATGIGVRVTGDAACVTLSSVEVHGRNIPIPDEFDLGERLLGAGARILVSDDFAGSPGDLVGRVTSIGGKAWQRLIGLGCVRVDGAGSAKVQGTVADPCPGRTAFAIGWANPRFADVTVTITPPGTQRGNRERSRAGLIFWQDANNYITLSVFVDDWYGTSIAAFFQVDGFEELYDAVWTNVGKRIHWGVPYEFRVVFDGQRFLAFVDGEPVLYRALSDIYSDWERLDVRAVGIVANWEWGNDTGSVFRNFIARDMQ